MGLELSFDEAGVAVVVGGSGGVGSAICGGFAAAGVDVAFTYRKNKSSADGVASNADRQKRVAAAYQLDLRDSKAAKRVIDDIAKRFGRIHTLVYASGPLVELKPISDISPEQFGDFLQQDLQGFFNVSHAAMPYLRQSKGSLVACVTMAIKRVLPRDGLSSTPKSGVESLVRQFAVEEGRNGVRANAVALGWITVGVGDPKGGPGSLVESFGADEIEILLKHSALGRGGSGQELSNIVLFLASKQASYVTGQTIFADGGLAL